MTIGKRPAASPRVGCLGGGGTDKNREPKNRFLPNGIRPPFSDSRDARPSIFPLILPGMLRERSAVLTETRSWNTCANHH
jgi:hypothetical protein